jgi:putative oxidoreductase
MASLDNKYSDIALLLLRLGVGIIFLVSGWGKLTGIEGVTGFFGNIGVPMPFIMAWVVALVEFFGGIMVLLGAYAKIPYLLLAIIMLVAIFLVKMDQGFSASRLEIMLLLASLALFFMGSGNYSVDHKMANR